MNFVTGLPNTAKGNDVIWVIMDMLTKSAYFIPIKISFSLQKLAEIYINLIVKLHDIPYSIVFDIDPRFTSIFLGGLQDALGSKLRLSYAYHPQTVGQTERMI